MFRVITGPGVVAYPVISLTGAKAKFNRGEGKYEVFVKNGTTYLSIMEKNLEVLKEALK